MKKCIYCSKSFGQLTTEHVIPAGLGGTIKLDNASCSNCAKITSKVELRILRGHWWAYRRHTNTVSKRHKLTIPPPVEVKVHKSNGDIISGWISIDSYPLVLTFILFRPGLLTSSDSVPSVPYARTVGFLTIKETPSEYKLEDGRLRRLQSTDRIEIPVEYAGNSYDAGTFMQFLAKVAHSYAISKMGINCCKVFYLQDIILGISTDSMKYIGSASELLDGVRLENNCGDHHISIKINQHSLSVLIQLFNFPRTDPMPVYEIIVGMLLG